MLTLLSGGTHHTRVELGASGRCHFCFVVPHFGMRAYLDARLFLDVMLRGENVATVLLRYPKGILSLRWRS